MKRWLAVRKMRRTLKGRLMVMCSHCKRGRVFRTHRPCYAVYCGCPCSR